MPPTPVVIANGERLKQLRKERGLTPEALAYKVAPHRSGQTIRRIERGGKRTGVRFLGEIADALDVELAELVASDSEAA